METTTTTIAPTAPKTLFPDGLKTSGQHNPTHALLTPPSLFPKEITGPTVWKAEDYRHHPERWTHVFSAGEVDELGRAADDFIASGRPLTGMAKVGFHVDWSLKEKNQNPCNLSFVGLASQPFFDQRMNLC
jgi:hypothetical protein